MGIITINLNTLIDKWHSSILDVRFFSGADCDTVHYLVVAKVRERLAVSKQAAQTFNVERFNFRELMSYRLGNSITLRSQKCLHFGKFK
jgi:hypothetical protein